MTECKERIAKMISRGAKEFRRKAEETVCAVARKTERVLEIQKIRTKIRILQDLNTDDLKRIGRCVRERYLNGEETDPKTGKLCEDIAERESRIIEYKKEIESLS